MDTVVITGADGFLGSHLTRCFSQKGIKVYALVVPGSPLACRIQNVENVEVVEMQLDDWKSVWKRLPQEPLAFINLAWAGVSPESRNSIEKQSINISLCLNAVKLAAQLHAQRFILPGSTSEYSYSDGLINEKTPASPQNAYGAVKVATRFLCESLCEEVGVPFIYAVISGIYAADRADNNVIYYTINQLRHRKKPALTKLEQEWDYVYISDVEQAFYKIALKGRKNRFYVIGHGDNCPLNHYIYIIRDLIDPELPLGIGEVSYKDGRLPRSCVDLTSLKEDTGYMPQVSFEEGIQKVIETVKENLKNE